MNHLRITYDYLLKSEYLLPKTKYLIHYQNCSLLEYINQNFETANYANL